MPSTRIVVGGKREKHWDEESANSTCTFLSRHCEAYAADNVATSANPRFSMFLVGLCHCATLCWSRRQAVRAESNTGSARLWMVELVQYRHWEGKMWKVSGTIVLRTAWRQNTFLRLLNVFNMRVVRYRSSRSRRRFFLWRASITEYSKMSGFARIGTQSSIALWCFDTIHTETTG